MEVKKNNVVITADRPIDRACGILLGVMGILGCAIPFVKQPMREALQYSVSGIGTVLTIFTIISKTTNETTNV